MRRIGLFLGLVWLFAAGRAELYAGRGCEYRLPSRLTIGGQGYVLEGQANNIRAEPAASSAKVGVIPALGVFKVLAGPSCNEEDWHVWWQVEYEGVTGWTAEGTADEDYFVGPYQNGHPNEFGEKRDTALQEEQLTLDSRGQVSFQGVTITVPGVSGQAVTARLYPSVNPYNTDVGFWEILPAHVGFLVPTAAGATLWLEVYPAALYTAYYPQSVLSLRASLNARQLPARLDDDLVPMNASLVMQARAAYLDMPWGGLYRDLRDYAQGVYPIPSDYRYTALGLTADDRYLVIAAGSVQVPMPQPLLDMGQPGYPVEASELEGANYVALIARAQALGEAFINDAPPAAFDPQLETFDQILGSLSIAPEALAAYQEVPLELLQFPPTPYPPRIPATPQPTAVPPCPGGAASELVVGKYAQQALNVDPVRVRLSPGGEYAGFDVPPGEIVNVLDGPQCADSNGQMVAWWQIERVGGKTGWVAEMVGAKVFFKKW